MQFLSKAPLKMWAIAALAPVLTACSFAPGMRLNGESAAMQVDSGSISKLVAITPALLRAERTAREQQPRQDISALVASPEPYLIGIGDILSIVVWDHPELSAADNQGYVVDQDGLVQFPFVGALKLAGLTQQQARTLLTAKVSRTLKKPDLTLRVQAFRSKRIYIDGEVKLTGTQPINDIPMTLMEGLNRAGGLSAIADQSQIYITRTGVTYRIDLPQLVKNGVNPASILLADGDLVRVASREESRVFVLGEVNRPISLLMRNGHLTLNEALGEASGLNALSSGAQVYVVRNAQDRAPTVYFLDSRSPTSLALAESFELKTKDVVYVDPAPLARWNRVVSLILPSAQSVTGTAQALK